MERILLVEDEDSIRGFLKINLQRNNFDVIEAATGEEGIELAKLMKPQVAILDVMLPGIDGFMVCNKLRSDFPGYGNSHAYSKGPRYG